MSVSSASNVLGSLKEDLQNREQEIRQTVEFLLNEIKVSEGDCNRSNFAPSDRSTPIQQNNRSPELEIIHEEEHKQTKPIPATRRMNRQISLEDSPVKPGIDGKRVKTFEELLELSLMDESLVAPQNDDPKEVPKIKRPFLKRGTGLNRFQAKVETSRIRRPCQKVQTNGQTSPNKPTVRKIAVNVLPKTETRKSPARKSCVVTGNPMRSCRTNLNAKFETHKNGKNTSLDNLERLLQSVKSRKEELLTHNDVSDGTETVSDGSDSCWTEEEEEDSDVAIEGITKNGKKVRWHDSPSRMSKPKPGVYSKTVKNYMSTLESKLHRLQKSCSAKLRSKAQVEQPKKPQANEVICREISELKQQIASLSDGIKALQLYTSTLKNTVEERRQPVKKPNVKITREQFPNSTNSSRSTTPARVQPQNEEGEADVKFGNGDHMKVLKDGTVIYTFFDGTLQTTFPDGSKLVEFKNGQMERTLTNGLRQITYPNRCQRIINPDGSEEVIMADGTITRVGVDGTEVVILPNGEREVRSSQYTRREYKNGCVKTVYIDGTQETRYPNGRLRIKDKHDKVLIDSMVRPLTQIH